MAKSNDRKGLRKLTGPEWVGDLICFIAGGLLTLSFAPFRIYILAVLSLALLLFFWLDVSPKRAFWRGFLYGVCLLTSGVYWIFISIHTYGNSGIPLAVIITGLLIAAFALFPAVIGYLLTKLFPQNTLTKLLIAFPGLWFVGEWVQTWFLTGFPWLLVGYSQINSPLRGYAPIISVYGISYLVALTAALIVSSLQAKRQQWYYHLVAIFAIWLVGGALHHIHWTHLIGKPITVSAIQGNIPQTMKWDPKAFDDTLKTYYDLTTQHWNSNLIVWPEAAIPVPRQYVTGFLLNLDQQTAVHNDTLITGIPIEAVNGDYYNALLMLGNNQGYYYKRHLVPFGEFVPFASILRGMFNFFSLPMSNLIPGPKYQPDLSMNGIIIAPFICYEIVFPSEVRSDLPKANVLLTTSDDSWFGQSIAQAQHLAMAEMRSLETGRPQIFSSNNGLTALISDRGRILTAIPPFQRLVLNGTIQPMAGYTPWIFIGFMPLFILVLLSLLLAFILDRRK